MFTKWFQLPEGAAPGHKHDEAECCSSTDAPGCVVAQESISLFQPVVFITAVLQLKERGDLEVTLQLLFNRLLCAAGG